MGKKKYQSRRKCLKEKIRQALNRYFHDTVREGCVVVSPFMGTVYQGAFTTTSYMWGGPAKKITADWRYRLADASHPKYWGRKTLVFFSEKEYNESQHFSKLLIYLGT